MCAGLPGRHHQLSTATPPGSSLGTATVAAAPVAGPPSPAASPPAPRPDPLQWQPQFSTATLLQVRRPSARAPRVPPPVGPGLAGRRTRGRRQAPCPTRAAAHSTCSASDHDQVAPQGPAPPVAPRRHGVLTGWFLPLAQLTLTSWPFATIPFNSIISNPSRKGTAPRSSTTCS